MRRPALYLAGLFLATGASLALAAPASAAGTHCKKHYGAAAVHGHGHGAAYGHRVGGSWYPYDDDYGYYGGIGNDYNRQSQYNQQVGLFNINTGPIGF